MKNNPDRRFFVSMDRETVIAVNLKCGYATVNHALIASNEDPKHIYSLSPGDDCDKANRVVLFVRDPVSRFASFYRNWIVNHKYDAEKPNSVQQICRRHMRSSIFERFVESTIEERESNELMALFLQEMGPAIINERHLAPQWYMLQSYGIELNKKIQILNYRENIAFLDSEYSLQVKIQNRAKVEKSTDLSFEIEEECKYLYARGYDMFGDVF